MEKSSSQKLKLLYLIQIFEEKTNAEHVLNAAELIQELEQYHISAERKSIYRDIELLCDFGYDIIHVKTRQEGGYYLASRAFEEAELKLLVDAVQSSRFITQKKSKELIEKLEKLTSKYEAKKLQRQVYVSNRIKTDNESIYNNIDYIHKAIQENRQISFQYMEWNEKKQLVPRKKGERYLVSPYGLLWNEEKYYLVGFSKKEQEIRHYRVDKMGNIELCPEKREGMEHPELFDIAAYSNQLFGMYGGQSEIITLQFEKSLLGVVIDRFGKDISIRKRDENLFSARVSVVQSNQFYGWLSGLGLHAKILEPKQAQAAYKDYLLQLLQGYENNLVEE